MSDVSRFIPTGLMGNIASIGADRLADAKSVVQDKIAKNNMVKGIEASLGGLKTVTFGKDVFNAGVEGIGKYIKNRGQVKAQNAARAEEAEAEGGADVDAAAGAAQTGGTIQMTAIQGGRVAQQGGGAATAPGDASADMAASARAAPKPFDATGATPAPKLPDPATKPADAGDGEIAGVGEEGGIAEAGAVGEMGALDVLGGILDATGIGAPLGLALGFIGLGLAGHKSAPVTLDTPNNRQVGGFSYQMGV